MSLLTDADCERISAQLIAHSTSGYRNSDGSFRTDNPDVEENRQLLMRELLPNPDSLRKFRDWSHKQCNLIRQLPEPASAADLVKTIEKTNFLSEDSRTTLCDMLSTDLRSYVGLGMYLDYHYCLRMDLLQLVPEDYDIDQMDPRDILPGSILGINLTKTSPQSNNRRKNNDSDESASSNSSTGNDDTGFTFMQLGRVDYLSHDSRKSYEKSSHNPVQMPWSDSGFVLVVAIERDGTPGAPWLIFNFKPESEIEGDRVRIPRTGRFWGTLLGDKTQRLAVKLGDKMSDLEDKKPWCMTTQFGTESEAQIVAAVFSTLSTRGNIFRQKVPDVIRSG
ncbi:uncharacterized protein J4E78_005848 [Alternaria triticimaculans]|uniref:uncharacterized protein n=1 Tax=Alternaria triticimaculans TaxID=297637 RepID=UPI0020C348A0|nr:uncharacterized protein J4E78_005848 [Alternaria triticimaculans]KAI4659420.1 hypothetical protein J4E78_005848 [Alternaria triticimaculans]